MGLTREGAKAAACEYFKTQMPPELLGWGIGGWVFLSPEPGRVVKLHNEEAGFVRELETYRRLRDLRLSRLHGLTIPKMLGYRPDLRAIEMDFVIAPYLLDFAGVRFEPPDFSDDTMEKWHSDIAEAYGPNAWIIYRIYESLSKHAIWYMDFRVSNVKLEGHADAVPYTPPSIDDLPW